jgi:hypothetical protein
MKLGYFAVACLGSKASIEELSDEVMITATVAAARISAGNQAKAFHFVHVPTNRLNVERGRQG